MSCVSVGNVYWLGFVMVTGLVLCFMMNIGCSYLQQCPPTLKKSLLILKQSRLLHIMPHGLLSEALKCTDKYSHITRVRRCLIPYWIILINILRHLVMHQIQHLIEHLSRATLIHKDAIAQTLWQPHWLRRMWHISQPRRNEVTLSHLEERTEAG